MRKFILIPVFLLSLSAHSQDIYKGAESTVTFFSSSPLEDIEAKNSAGVTTVLRVTDNKFQAEIKNKDFIFDSAMMQEHFNEKYMESDKYPVSKFSGTIVEKVDYTKEGTYGVTVKGQMNMHGVSRDIEVKGKITVKSGLIQIDAKFPVRVADYKIPVPTLYIKNIAEVVDVTVKSTLKPFKK